MYFLFIWRKQIVVYLGQITNNDNNKMYNNVYSFVIITLVNLLQGFFLRALKFINFFYVILNLPVIITPLRTYLYDQTKF